MDLDFSQALEQLEEMLNNFIRLIPNILVAVIVFLLFYFLASGFKAFVRRLSARYSRHVNVALILGRLVRWLVITLGLLVALVISFPGFTASRLLELLGISTVAIGFAFRDVLQNFLAGILILLNEPFHVGDQIIVQELEGTVESIETRATTILTYDGRRIVIPNTDLFNNPVTVNTAFPHRRVEYDLGVGYGNSIEEAKAMILEVLGEMEHILAVPAPDVIVIGLDASWVTLRLRWWIEPARWAEVLETRDHVLATVKERLIANGIDLPFPTRQILFHDQTEETDGHRALQREGWPAGRGEVPAPRTIAGALKSGELES
ncbi:MAG: mechanosensitive ion channel family protein [Anaerolineales bacterium]